MLHRISCLEYTFQLRNVITPCCNKDSLVSRKQSFSGVYPFFFYCARELSWQYNLRTTIHLSFPCVLSFFLFVVMISLYKVQWIKHVSNSLLRVISLLPQYYFCLSFNADILIYIGRLKVIIRLLDNYFHYKCEMMWIFSSVNNDLNLFYV